MAKRFQSGLVILE